ncbi:DUF6090 family protein [Alteromonas lipolytica]|uniref:Uncharacterized protein n=1 Tax=Alteromonas lipolytica TaxID=1856405 RepID=A0A1E8FK20_9ALTE|nr:DUF6090 family protein [Alteromonas lipolytica]OFI36287.1 hypothetical protein BFC17_09210 [Alteromonas lipolytica]GGF79418.1 hypothetical protein GCM10011338_34730 [Alteromonas lipolytica]
MLIFFKRIRKKLLSENRITAYSRYAIGEIILVVVGILIALQINNWNENRKAQKKLHNIYALIVEDLKNDIADIDQLIQEQNRRKVILDKILNDEISKEEYESCTECRFVLIGFPNLSIDQRGYNLLQSHADNNKINSESLQIAISQFYSKHLYDISADDGVRQASLQNNIFYWEQHTNWFADYITDRDYSGFIEYATISQDYKNRVAMYRLLHFDIFDTVLFSFKQEANKIIERIEQELARNE